MGFLNQSIAQIRDLFASMTPAARITAALLLSVIGVSLAYLFQDYTNGSKERLLNGDSITAAEADRMQAAIAQAGLNDAVREGNQILVPRGQTAQYLAAVADAGALPAKLDTLLLDTAANASLIEDRPTREARLKAAREQMITMIIRKMDGVEDANVVFDIREPKGFEKRLITAMVSVRPAPGEELTSRRQQMIRLAVCGAIAGLNPKDVSILNLRDRSQWESASGVEPADFSDPYFQTRTTYENQMKQRIEDLLRYIPGLRVQVTAELDDTISAETRSITSQGDTQTISEQTEESVITDAQVEDRGRPGPSVQGPNRAPPEESVARNEHKTETSSRNADSFVPTTQEDIRRAGFVPKDVRASIAVPSDYILSVWRERNPDAAADARPSAADIDNISTEQQTFIEGSVSQLLPRQPENAPYPNVRVTVYQSMTPPPTVEPTTVSKALLWASSNSGSLIMAGLALVSLVMLRGMVKGIPSPETNVILSMSSGANASKAGDGFRGAEGGGDGGGAGPGAPFAGGGRAAGDGSRPKLRLKKGPSLKDDLTEMVRDDPDAAAAILRSWISTAG
jgi:flagellar M-ring protein FliF